VKRYPLEALRSVREHQVDEKRERLAAENLAVQRAQARASAASEALSEKQAERHAVADQELQRAATGVARAEDFQRAADYRAGAVQREQSLSEALKHEQQALRNAEQQRVLAEAAVAAARAEAKVIERHRSQFQSEQLKRQENELEEAAQEVWGGAARLRGPQS
jgi:hypothetical protein